MKRFICLTFLFSYIYWLPINAQQCFFYNEDGNKIYLEKIDSLIFIDYEDNELQVSKISNQNISNSKKITDIVSFSMFNH